MKKWNLKVSILKNPLSVCQLNKGESIPDWIYQSDFFTISRTYDEISIIIDSRVVPDVVKCEHGWVALKIEGVFEFELTGVLASILVPLAENGISIFALSTYNTDYVLVKSDQLSQTIQVLREFGHQVVEN